MIYPVNDYKNSWNNTAGYGFGAATSYGFHEGVDINDNGGGDSDLGKPIFAITDGELIYYHTNKHPGSGFGSHHVYKIVGAWGVRWIHNAHCQPGAIFSSQEVKEGQQIAKLGKSGTQYAHLHHSVFKVDPVTLRDGIDTIAKTQTELTAWWEDPIKFIERWMKAGGDPVDDQVRKDRDRNWNLYTGLLKVVCDNLGVAHPSDPLKFNNQDVIKAVTDLKNKPSGDPRAQKALELIQAIKNF